ncbi:Thioredoxin [Lachnospiraceae bacterium TWA4]|nr:Thioredoxin [Lachnospiraceae bacterium TWA4]
MAVQIVNNENFEEVVLNAKEPVLVDIWATWCGPCKALAPIVEEVANEAKGFSVAKIDADENGDIAMKYKVRSIPTLLVFKDGEVVNRSVGVISKEEILELLEV